MKKVIKNILESFRSLIFTQRPKSVKIIFKYENLETEIKKDEVVKRLKYFNQNISIKFQSKLNLLDYFDYSIIAFCNSNYNRRLFFIKRDCVFDFDYDRNYVDGWEYHRLLRLLNTDLIAKHVARGKALLIDAKASLERKYTKAYILGTGPSLEKALEKDWSDGVRIVSNTIVKDEELWKHIDPHFIVAGDAIYHFGFTNFSKAFREDLRQRMLKSNAYFVFPDLFLPLCLKEFGEFNDRLIPIPQGTDLSICKDLTKDYYLPALGNVLPLLLLPLSCTLAKNIYLWGFDGRSPDDKLFWKNSSKHFYTEHVDNIIASHPAFFNKLVPKDNPESYVKTVHGDVLEDGFVNGEKNGYTFNMMHFSYTENLNKRYI